MKPKIDIYSGHDPTRIPTYSLGESAHYLQLPRSTVASWALGRSYPTASGVVRFRPVIRVADPALRFLSFQNLVELHVLSAIRRVHRVQLPAVRKAVEYLRRHLKTEHPLADEQMLTDGKDLFIRQYQSLVNVSQEGQLEMRELVEAYLRRIERDPRGLPIRLYPFATNRAEDSRVIVIDPRLRFGRPCIAGRGILTSIVASRYKAGDSIGVLAKDYACTAIEIEDALRYEYRLRAAS